MLVKKPTKQQTKTKTTQTNPPENSKCHLPFKILESEFSASRFVHLTGMEKEVERYLCSVASLSSRCSAAGRELVNACAPCALWRHVTGFSDSEESFTTFMAALLRTHFQLRYRPDCFFKISNDLLVNQIPAEDRQDDFQKNS